MREIIVEALAGSRLNELTEHWLRTVPGLPPIAQAFHIMGVSVVMGTVVLIDLRLLGLGFWTQNVNEMIRRLMPWVWWALLVNATSGLLFVVTRPARYFYNPVAEFKFTALAVVGLLALFLHGRALTAPDYWERSLLRRVVARGIAVVSLLAWLCVVFAGRWIAYDEYVPQSLIDWWSAAWRTF